MKKKIGGFIDGLTKKEEEKEPEKKPDETPEKAPEKEKIKEKPKEEKKPEPRPETAQPKPEKKVESHKLAPGQAEKPRAEPARPEPIAEKKEPAKRAEPKKQVEKQVPIIEKPAAIIEKMPIVETKPSEVIAPEVKMREPEPPPKVQDSQEASASLQETKQKERIKLGIAGTLKSIITREVRIEEKDVKEMLESLELELLEADVDLSVAEAIKETLNGKLVGAKINKEKLHSFVSQAIRETLIEILTNEKTFTIPERLEKSEKPLKIMFLGINGAGKTTTIAKVAKMLINENKKVVFAAADTFRAAAIEQMGVHADRLGVKVIKREYGSDPTSVAYDAVNYAKAHGIDAVLIDTAGRQDTNISLMNEMKKMNRIIQPDIKIYIGESIAGNAIIEQVSAFNREIGVDAVILTKLDCDPKGGTMLSINKASGIPIIYVGVGQAYDDLERFEPEKIVQRIVE